MKDWIKEKLEKIDELYPKERLDSSKERWTRLWTGRKQIDRYPFLFTPTIQYYNVSEPDIRLREYLDMFIFRGVFKDDFIPSFFPGCRQATIPNMFGSREVIIGDDYSGEKIIEKAEDIDDLMESSITKGTIAYEWLEFEKYLIEETEGRIPCNVIDMQGPLDVCGQLWGYDNIILAAYETPKYYAKIMEKATNAFIKLWKAQQKAIGEELFVGTHLFGWNWVPKNNGATLSMDSLVMVSPDFFDEFVKLYLGVISSSLNGLVIHSCGDFKHIVDNLNNMSSSIKGLNAGQMSFKELISAGVYNGMILVLNTKFDALVDIFTEIRDRSYNACLSIDIFPDTAGKPLDVDDWDKKDWESILARQDKVIELASQNI